MSISITSFTNTDRLEMHIGLFKSIPEPESFSYSLCPMHCTLTTTSVDGKTSNISMSYKFETGEHQSIRPSFSTGNFITTSRITDKPEINFDHFFIFVNEQKFITQSSPGTLECESRQNDCHKPYYSISNSRIGSAHHLTSFRQCSKIKDSDLAHAPPFSGIILILAKKQFFKNLYQLTIQNI